MSDDKTVIQSKLTAAELAELDRIRVLEPGIPSRAEMVRRLASGEATHHPTPKPLTPGAKPGPVKGRSGGGR